MDPTEDSLSHPSEESLEMYALDRLPEDQAACLEEHLLLCEPCRGLLVRTEDYVRLMRVALRHPAPAAPEPVPVPMFLPRLNLGPRGVWAASMVGLCAIALFPWSQSRDREPAPVMLSSFRGSQIVSMAHGPAGAPLDLGIDAAFLTPGEDCRVEIVDARGRPAWDGKAARAADGKLLAKVVTPLGAGTYWVRLYRADAELVQEFGLELE